MKRLCGFSLILGVLVIAAPSARACLGGDILSIDADGAALSVKRFEKHSVGPYQVHELRNNATRIREFAEPGGKVFAVSWQGRVTPDLKSLLGSYFGDFQQALRSQEQKKRRVRVPFRQLRGSEVVVETWGHFGSIGGRSYVANLLPKGVNLNDLH